MHTPLPRRTSPLQQDKVITRCNTRLTIWFLCLPPPPADIANLEDIVFLEADLVRVIRVRLVAVDGLGAVWVFNAVLLWLVLCLGWCLGVHTAELRGG